MTLHQKIETRSALPIETREDDPLAAATAAVDELRSASEQFRTQQATELRGITERLASLETRLNRPGTHQENRDDNTVELRALSGFLRTGDETEMRAAATDNNPDGGWLVLPTVDTTIRNLMLDVSPMRGLAETVTISGGEYQRFYSLGKRGAQKVVERDDRPQDTERPGLILQSYGTGEYYAAPTATRHLLEDASADIANWLLAHAANDFAVSEGEDFMHGDGASGFAKGLLTYGTTPEKDFVRPWGKHQYIPAGHASSPTDDHLAKALIALMLTLRKPYRANARWLMNPTTAIRVRQIQDTAKRFLWAPIGNLVEGEQGTLLGYPVEYDDEMPNIGTDEHPIAFGDFRQGYVIVDRHGIRVERDAVTKKGRVVFDTYKRVGGGAADFNAIKFLKIAAS